MVPGRAVCSGKAVATTDLLRAGDPALALMLTVHVERRDLGRTLVTQACVCAIPLACSFSTNQSPPPGWREGRAGRISALSPLPKGVTHFLLTSAPPEKQGRKAQEFSLQLAEI